MASQREQIAGEVRKKGPEISRCPIRRVLVCLDRSEFDEHSLAAAVTLVGASTAQVTLLHVLEPSIEFGCACPTDPLAWEFERRETLAYLNRLRAGMEASGIDSRVRVVEGHAAKRILAEMRDDGIDVTILARHGRQGASEWSLGSTVQKVLSRSRGSVLIVPAQLGELSWRTPPRRVVVPLDGSVRAECALALARTLATLHSAELVLVHVVSEPSAAPQPSLERDDTDLVVELTKRWERSARLYLGRFLVELRASHSATRYVLERSSDVRRTLLDVAHRENADLVVLSAHGVTCDVRRPYGSVAEHLINYCDRPLLMVQDLQFASSDHVPTEAAAPPLARGRLR